MRTGSRVDYTKLGAILGINRNKLKDYIHLLQYTYFTLPVTVFSKNPDRELSKQQKIYISDTGLLQQLAQVSSGQVFENAIAIQLARMGQIQYYQKLSGQEIDFILDEKTAIEVKETPTESDYNTLLHRAKSINLEDYMLIGRRQPVSDFNNFYWGGGIGSY